MHNTTMFDNLLFVRDNLYYNIISKIYNNLVGCLLTLHKRIFKNKIFYFY